MAYVAHHPHIPYDQVALERSLYLAHNRPRISWRGPHEGREMGLMKAGLKYCAIVSSLFWGDEWIKACEDNGWTYRHCQMETAQDYYVATKGEEWRIDALDFVYDHVTKNNKMLQSHHIVVGSLLGYRRTDIDLFLKNLQRFYQVHLSEEDKQTLCAQMI